MSENKTKPTGASVEDFLKKLDNEKRKKDGFALLKIFKNITKMEPEMWGPSIIGFGTYRYKLKSGREGDMPRTGFSPRKANLTLYVADEKNGFDEFKDLLEQLGKHKIGKSCLYINKLEDIDIDVLKEMIDKSFKATYK